MSWICKPQPEVPMRLQMKSSMSELKKIDPKTRQIYTQILSEDVSHNVSKYEDWSRVKIQTINTRDLAKHLRQSKKSFSDPEFPHHNSMLSSGFFTGQIKWVRVIDLVQNAVYSKEQTRSTLENIKLNRPAFQKALVLIARTSPSLYKELLSKTLNREGLYQFKLFRDGFVQNVVVDDYIPTHQGLPIFVGPVRQNQVYPMLLEKALAKVCGSYQNIPEQAEDILEMIFCGPVTIKVITDLRQQNSLGPSLRSGLDNKQLTVLMSRKDPKIRNYGLNDSQVYMVVLYKLFQINHYEIEWGGQQLRQLQQSRTSFLNMSSLFRKNTIEDKKSLCYSRTINENSLQRSHIMQSSLYSKESKQNKGDKDNNTTKVEHIYQCISESRLSAWNGRFSLNDQVWSKMDPKQKSQLYKSIKDNRSFLINQTDVSRLFEEVLLFQTNETNNKDWIHNESHNSLPSFTRFQVSKAENIFIRVTTPSNIKQTVILARETATKQYEFVTSNFSSSSNKIDLSGQVYPGKYVIVCFHQWLYNKRGSYYVFLSSHHHITLAIAGLTDHQFLNKAINSLERLRPHNDKEQKEECTIRLQLQRLGLAYIVLKPYNCKSKTLTLKIDKNYLKKDNWEMMEPYNGLSQVTVSETFDRSETIIVMTKVNIDSNKKYYFPFAAFSIKK